VSEINIVI